MSQNIPKNPPQMELPKPPILTNLQRKYASALDLSSMNRNLKDSQSFVRVQSLGLQAGAGELRSVGATANVCDKIHVDNCDGADEKICSSDTISSDNKIDKNGMIDKIKESQSTVDQKTEYFCNPHIPRYSDLRPSSRDASDRLEKLNTAYNSEIRSRIGAVAEYESKLELHNRLWGRRRLIRPSSDETETPLFTSDSDSEETQEQETKAASAKGKEQNQREADILADLKPITRDGFLALKNLQNDMTRCNSSIRSLSISSIDLNNQ